MLVFFKFYEDFFGFVILGLCLGIVFSIINFIFSYLLVLRVGSGFEYLGEEYDDIDFCWIVFSWDYFRINSFFLKFISYCF